MVTSHARHLLQPAYEIVYFRSTFDLKKNKQTNIDHLKYTEATKVYTSQRYSRQGNMILQSIVCRHYIKIP